MTACSELSAIYAANSCGYTRDGWRELHARTGYTLGNVPPADFAIARLADCAPEAASFAARAAEGRAPGLLVTGRAGRGKTYTACAVARSVAEERSVGICTDAELVREAKAAFGSPRRTEAQVVERFCAPYLLVLDDFGKAAYSSDWALQLVFEVIDRRIRGGRPLVVTTQYDAAGLIGKLTVGGDGATAEAIVSRMQPFDLLRVEGEDRRAGR